MPRAFDRREREEILTALLDVGLKHFAARGVRKARVDDICRDVGIAKGSFYAFFKSKEDLFMTIANRRDEKHKADMRRFLLDASGTPHEIMSGFFDFLMDRIETDPVLRIVRDTGEIAYLMRKTSPELLAENARRDREFMIEVSDILNQRHNLRYADTETLEGLLTIMLSLSMQAEHIAAAGAYPSATALMRDLFLSRLLRGPLDDRSG